MDPNPAPFREVALPVSVLDSLRRALAAESGSLQSIHTLHAAGREGGTEAAAAFRKSSDERPEEIPENVFWTRLGAFFGERGWGTVKHEDVHPAVGLLTSDNWAESSGATHRDPDASCSFTAGFLSGLLTALAGGPVAVLEVDCRARGDRRCAFAFGSEAAVHELYGHLLDASDLEAALAKL